MKEIILYQKRNGEIPVKIFLDDLEIKNPKLYSKTWLKIKLLIVDNLGNEDIKYIGDKIYELRLKQSSNISRIFYFTIKNEKIVLLDGILKKTQKLDNSIIERVKKFKDDFLFK
ncbi:MAG: type II toxin-antitoxin system RelE/ParE family toxin [Candidatus Gracilibacteria bacterium]|nr:type II toxin-antitoxin system RelE/ParE family toxin [Candidatus Gracilibacteria bacterium]